MTYNFDEVIERRGTDSVKWDGVKSVWDAMTSSPCGWRIWISARPRL